MKNKSLKIGVLGLGLIGGSILKALKLSGKYYLAAVSKSSYKKAEEFSDVSSPDINILKDVDVVFVCSKMSDTPDILSKLEEILPPDTVVADVCSIKGFLNREYKFNYIPSHPMAGTEFFGFENSFAELFKDAKWVLGKENETLIELIETMGAKPVILNSFDHDKFAAQISHFPMLLSMALFNSADENAKKIAASGFRDTTRLAATNSDMAFDMVKYNRENIISAYEKFNLEFLRLLDLSEEEFKETVKNIAQKRCKMYDKNGKNTLC